MAEQVKEIITRDYDPEEQDRIVEQALERPGMDRFNTTPGQLATLNALAEFPEEEKE